MRLTALAFYLLLAGTLCLLTLSAWDAQISYFDESIDSFRKQEEKYREQNDLKKIDLDNQRFIIHILPHWERHLHQSVRIRETILLIGFGLLGSVVFIVIFFFKRVKRSARMLMVREPEKSLSRSVYYGLTVPGLILFTGALIVVVLPVGIREPLYFTDHLKHAVVKYCFFTCLFLWGLALMYLSRLHGSSATGRATGCVHASLLLFYILGFMVLLIITSDIDIIPNFAQ